MGAPVRLFCPLARDGSKWMDGRVQKYDHKKDKYLVELTGAFAGRDKPYL